MGSWLPTGRFGGDSADVFQLSVIISPLKRSVNAVRLLIATERIPQRGPIPLRAGETIMDKRSAVFGFFGGERKRLGARSERRSDHDERGSIERSSVCVKKSP